MRTKNLTCGRISFLDLKGTMNKPSTSLQVAMYTLLKYLRTSSACQAASASSSHALVFSCQVSKSPNSGYNKKKNYSCEGPFSLPWAVKKSVFHAPCLPQSYTRPRWFVPPLPGTEGVLPQSWQVQLFSYVVSKNTPLTWTFLFCPF